MISKEIFIQNLPAELVRSEEFSNCMSDSSTSTVSSYWPRRPCDALGFPFFLRSFFYHSFRFLEKFPCDVFFRWQSMFVAFLLKVCVSLHMVQATVFAGIFTFLKINPCYATHNFSLSFTDTTTAKPPNQTRIMKKMAKYRNFRSMEIGLGNNTTLFNNRRRR